jgi:type III pantothenate kinase
VLFLQVLKKTYTQQMYLVIDRGNTRTKIACFSNPLEYEVSILERLSCDALNSLLDDFEKKNGGAAVSHGIYSSVVRDNQEMIACLEQRIELMLMSPACPVPVSNLYNSPETLGNDRIAAAVAAANLYSGCDVLSIDAGTCITYDFINASAEYLGGGIAPGLGLRFKALHTFTSKLPLVSLDEHVGLIGDTTAHSIQSGVYQGVMAEVDGIIDRYKMNYPGLKTILTGGDANYFDKKLKNDIFAVPNLVLLGLKDILQYNVEK